MDGGAADQTAGRNNGNDGGNWNNNNNWNGNNGHGHNNNNDWNAGWVIGGIFLFFIVILLVIWGISACWTPAVVGVQPREVYLTAGSRHGPPPSGSPGHMSVPGRGGALRAGAPAGAHSRHGAPRSSQDEGGRTDVPGNHDGALAHKKGGKGGDGLRY